MPLDPLRTRLLWKAQPHYSHGPCNACGNDQHRYGTRRSCLLCLSCFTARIEHAERRAARAMRRISRAMVAA